MPEPCSISASAVCTSQNIAQGRFELAGAMSIAEQPVRLGGLEADSMPQVLLAAALATCTTMTLRFYATRLGWDIGTVRTHAVHRSVPDRFERSIMFDRRLAPAVRAELLQAAERCPMHRTLTSGMAIFTDFAVGEGGRGRTC